MLSASLINHKVLSEPFSTNRHLVNTTTIRIITKKVNFATYSKYSYAIYNRLGAVSDAIYNTFVRQINPEYALVITRESLPGRVSPFPGIRESVVSFPGMESQGS